MSGSPTLDLQGAIVARLKATPAVAAIVGDRVYDFVPRREDGVISAEFPFVAFAGDDTLQDDVDCVVGYDISLTLDVWSRAVGYPEARRLAAVVAKALHNWPAPLQSHKLVTLQHRQTLMLRDPDGLTSHGVIRLRATVTE